jgi:hypothetical protein
MAIERDELWIRMMRFMDDSEGLPGYIGREDPHAILARLEAEISSWDAQVRAHLQVLAEAGGPKEDFAASIWLSERLWSLLWLVRFGETYEEFTARHGA